MSSATTGTTVGQPVMVRCGIEGERLDGPGDESPHRNSPSCPESPMKAGPAGCQSVMNPLESVSDPAGPGIFQQLRPRSPLVPALSLITARFQLRQETLGEFDGSHGAGIRNALYGHLAECDLHLVLARGRGRQDRRDCRGIPAARMPQHVRRRGGRGPNLRNLQGCRHHASMVHSRSAQDPSVRPP